MKQKERIIRKIKKEIKRNNTNSISSDNYSTINISSSGY